MKKTPNTWAMGAMLVEGMLAVLVILACTAGLGIGKFERDGRARRGTYLSRRSSMRQENRFRAKPPGIIITIRIRNGPISACHKKWARLSKVGETFFPASGIPLKLGIGIMAVLVASFAATTLDTATRLQRYVIQELAQTVRTCHGWAESTSPP